MSHEWNHLPFWEIIIVFLLTGCVLRNTKYIGTEVHPSYETTGNNCSSNCYYQEGPNFCYFWSFNKVTNECFGFDQGISEVVDLDFISGIYDCDPYV